jgi:CHAD domain-containing protein
MNNLIKKYLQTQDSELLHKIRVLARKQLSKLQQKKKTDISLKQLLKLSSKIRDADVLIQKCKNNKIKTYLIKQKNEEIVEFLKFLNSFSPKIRYSNKSISIKKCKQICSKNFLKMDDRELHKIRILVKKCRYSLNDERLKLLQTYLGEAHDYYNCIQLKKRFKLKHKKEDKLKKRFIKKAYTFCKELR